MSNLRILHNDTCPICAREVAAYDRQARKAGHDWDIDGLDAAPDWGLDREGAARVFRVECGGRRLEGLAAFRAVWARLPGWRWLARFTGLPGVHWLADRAYRHAAAPALYAMHRRRTRQRG